MPSPYTPVPTPLPATIDLPDDGDLDDASSVNVPDEAALDAIANLELPQTDPSESPPIASRDLNIAQVGTLFYDATEWFVSGSSSEPILEAVGSTAVFLTQELKMPHNCVLKELDVFILPAGGHGALPATMPSWTLYEKNMLTGANTSIISQADTSVNTTQYELYHSIRDFPALTIDRAKRYFLVFNNEGGANADSNLRFEGIVTVCTVTSMDVGAS